MENKELQIIKRTVPTICPHCNKELFIGFQSMISSLTSVSTREDIDIAKKEIKERIKHIKFKDPKKLEEINAWINKENTLLDNSDIDDLMKQLLLENE